jgi:hypothetical protein
MTTRQDIINLLMQQAAAQQSLIDQLIQTAPGDYAALQLANTQYMQIAQALQDALVASAGPPPADGGDGARAGIGPDATGDLGRVFMPPGVQAYDDDVPSARLMAVADLYYCYQHERLGLFRAVHRLQELFRAGTLKLEDGAGAVGLYQFDLKKFLRYTRDQRMQAYRRVFGYTQAAPPPGARPNQAFHGLLQGFATQIAQLFRDRRIAFTIRGSAASPDAAFGSVAGARRAGLDFRANLKQSAYGDVNVLSTELLQLLRQAFDILGATDVMRQFGTTTAWDTLEEVLIRHLNEQPQASQRSRMAETGRDLIRWLAHPFVLATSRPEFEGHAEIISEAAEEWITSAQSVGLLVGTRNAGRPAVPMAPPANVVPLRRAQPV